MPAKKHPHHETDIHKDYSHKPGEKKAGRPENVHVSASRVKAKDIKEDIRHRPEAPTKKEIQAAMKAMASKHAPKGHLKLAKEGGMNHLEETDGYGDE